MSQIYIYIYVKINVNEGKPKNFFEKWWVVFGHVWTKIWPSFFSSQNKKQTFFQILRKMKQALGTKNFTITESTMSYYVYNSSIYGQKLYWGKSTNYNTAKSKVIFWLRSLQEFSYGKIVLWLSKLFSVKLL